MTSKHMHEIGANLRDCAYYVSDPTYTYTHTHRERERETHRHTHTQ